MSLMHGLSERSEESSSTPTSHSSRCFSFCLKVTTWAFHTPDGSVGTSKWRPPNPAHYGPQSYRVRYRFLNKVKDLCPPPTFQSTSENLASFIESSMEEWAYAGFDKPKKTTTARFDTCRPPAKEDRFKG
ncbi:hypothetical protein HAX54_044808 [Datura stramonium]|uniref:Uncharacterized protein n=1 Tax=Datura stramonium TaxID=4076 RepID=A0ABS8WJ51_DATST|nr:hypothetical protein [Datura stramonium]